MRFLKFLLIFLSLNAFCQRILPFDSLRFRQASDLLADDYGSVYLARKSDFSLTKYDSLGVEAGKMLLAVPYRVQSVQNPLNIVLFSENAQSMKLVDQNLNEIQTVDFRRKFGFISAAYAEDLQQVWLLDASQKRLIQYDFRSDSVIAAWQTDVDLDEVLDMMVYEKKIYLLYLDHFLVVNFNSEKLFETKLNFRRRLRRENGNIFIIGKTEIHKLDQKMNLSEVFKAKDADFVDKNSSAFFELKGGKLYLYRADFNPK